MIGICIVANRLNISACGTFGPLSTIQPRQG
ncbi:hypothetical protein Plim_3946 [Planctopirus limnophila DSM 3776]|uniref:Uncharacterized protein n=1 Tax=Planctopirus limnophila (strain ATCC 43296 / DSM 3776 / IFAM 1008 / Mu 290) TaxID=521674 RepID=D5SXD5_PLAL2|nr:hypothetical protein Plim_3946 [Planctopirus limnophila DSM 3776]